MIQFKKIPLSKSVILLLLFLTTSINGFFQENDIDRRTSRINDDDREIRLSVDGPNGYFQNLPIRKMYVHKENYEKDRNTERLYDRRSFRTGTIQRNIDSRERSVEDQRSVEDIRDINNNNREHTRDNREHIQNRRTLSRNELRENRQPIRENNERRTAERSATSKINIVDKRRALPTTRGQRNTRDLTTRSDIIQNRRIDAQSVNKLSRNFKDTELDRRTIERSLPQRQINNRDTTHRVTSSNTDKQIFEDRSTRSPQTQRSVENQDRRSSERQNVDQSRLSDRFRTTESLARRNSVEPNRSIDRERQNTENRLARETSRRSLQSRYFTRSVEVENQKRLSNRIRSVERLARDNLRTDSGRVVDRENQLVEVQFARQSLETRLPTMRSLDYRRSSERRNMDANSLADRFRSAERLVGDNFRSDYVRLINRERRVTENRDFTRSLGDRDRKFEVQSRLPDRLRTTDRLVRDNSRVDSARVVDKERQITEERFPQDLSRLQARQSFRSGEYQNRRSSERKDRIANRQVTVERRGNIMSRQDRIRESFRRDLSRRLLDSRRETVPYLERLEKYSSERRPIENRSDRSFQRRKTDKNRSTINQRTADHREKQITNDKTRYVREDSRSDSTRKILDTTVFRDNRENIITRDNTDRRETLRILTEHLNTRKTVGNGLFDPSLANSGRYFERQISERISTNSLDNRERTSSVSERNTEHIKTKIDSSIWANAATVVLAAFLIGQMFVNTSKQKTFRLCNFMSRVTSIKEKTQ